MGSYRLGGVGSGAIVWLLCACQPSVPPKTAGGTNASDGVARSAPASIEAGRGGLPSIDPSLGRLVTVTVRSDFDAPPDVLASFQGIAAVSDDEVWVVGTGNLRARCSPSGCVPMSAATTRVPLGVVPGTCEAVPHFWHVHGRSPSAVYVASTASCGMDPSYVYGRPIERFDGTRWRELPGSQLAGTPSQGSVAGLWAGRADGLWVLVEGFDWEAALGNAIARYDGARYAPVSRYGLSGSERSRFSRALADPSSPGLDAAAWESFRSIVARDDGTAWAVGSHQRRSRSPDGEVRELSPAAWFFDGTQWAEAPLPAMPAVGEYEELSALALADDGSVWLGGEGLSRWDGRRWTRVQTGWSAPIIVRSIRAVSASDMWLVAARSGEQGGEAAVLHFDGKRLARLWAPSDAEEPRTLAGVGSSLWALGSSTLWRRLPHPR